ncbi:MAG TPA: efflux RND transporter periplasmic adaptor subunit, partial [Planctomycetaceae bacterium]
MTPDSPTKGRRLLRQAGRLLLRALVPAVLVGAGVVAVVWWPARPEAAAADAAVWTCSMHPQVRLPRPGRCPICGMALVPLDERQTGVAEVPGVEVEPVVRRDLAREVRTVGRIDYSEARVEEITARVAGRVDRLYVDFTGVRVEEGDHLVEVYSPDLYSAQQELLTAVESSARPRAGSAGAADRFSAGLLRSAREKLRLWGLTSEQIAEIEKSREPKTHLTVYSPLAGTVIEKNVRLGQYVEEGDLLYRIADLGTMWLYLELYEPDVGWVRYGQGVDVTLEAYPGETFRGTVVFIDPFLNDQTRTVRVRVNLPNPDGRLKAGMYATATIRAPLLADG